MGVSDQPIEGRTCMRLVRFMPSTGLRHSLCEAGVYALSRCASSNVVIQQLHVMLSPDVGAPSRRAVRQLRELEKACEGAGNAASSARRRPPGFGL
jgi:hypothetical protein